MAISTSRCKAGIKKDIKDLLQPVLDATMAAQGENKGDTTIDDLVNPIMAQVDKIVDNIFKEILEHLEINYKLTVVAGVPVPDPLHPTPPGTAHASIGVVMVAGSPSAQANLAPIMLPIDGVVIPEGKGFK